jgi:hypothetical protein
LGKKLLAPVPASLLEGHSKPALETFTADSRSNSDNGLTHLNSGAIIVAALGFLHDFSSLKLSQKGC